MKLEIQILPGLSERKGWIRFGHPAGYQAWAKENAFWLYASTATDVAAGVGGEYRLVPNPRTYLESLVVFLHDSPIIGPLWVLHVKDELSAVTALRMSLRAFADLREETGEGSPSSLEILP